MEVPKLASALSTPCSDCRPGHRVLAAELARHAPHACTTPRARSLRVAMMPLACPVPVTSRARLQKLCAALLTSSNAIAGRAELELRPPQVAFPDEHTMTASTERPTTCALISSPSLPWARCRHADRHGRALELYGRCRALPSRDHSASTERTTTSASISSFPCSCQACTNSTEVVLAMSAPSAATAGNARDPPAPPLAVKPLHTVVAVRCARAGERPTAWSSANRRRRVRTGICALPVAAASGCMPSSRVWPCGPRAPRDRFSIAVVVPLRATASRPCSGRRRP